MINIHSVSETSSSFQNIYTKYNVKGTGKVHPCTGTEALYRAYGP